MIKSAVQGTVHMRKAAAKSPLVKRITITSSVFGEQYLPSDTCLEVVVSL
jgi:hypothetical protein